MILDGEISYEDNGTSEGGRAGHSSRERERSGKDTEQYGVMMRRMATENLGKNILDRGVVGVKAWRKESGRPTP